MPAEPGRRFFDSNTLLYFISEDTEKARQIERHLYEGGCISVQVLNEFTNVARRKHGLAIGQIRPLLHVFRRVIDVVPVTVAIHEAGLTLAERYRLSTYDAMIAAAAIDSGCSILLSEDMHHGLKIEDRLEIRNPFV